MAWLATDKNGSEYIYSHKPVKGKKEWNNDTKTLGSFCSSISLPPGSIAKLIGRDLTWEDEPVELKE